jgi:hypothetical protein
VANFFAVIGSRQNSAEAAATFRRGLAQAQRIKGGAPACVQENGCAQMAVFARQNGSCAPIAFDEATGSWLFAAGSWFHSTGYGSGDEARLLAQFLQTGAPQVARELSGFFTLVFGNASTHETLVITDLIGSRHAFLREFEYGVAVASSSLLLASLAYSALDALGCEEFLRTGVIYEERTFFREVRKLAPASIYRFSDGKLRETERYWHIGQLAPDSLQGVRATEAFGESLVAAARQIGRVFPHLLCDLTGGYDSRLLVAGLLTAGVPFETTVTGAPGTPDVVIARGLAEITGQPHHPVEVEPHFTFAQAQAALALTDGEADIVEYGRNVLPVHTQTARQCALSLNGSFGEVARGYWWELLWPRTGRRLPLDARKLAAGRYVIDSGGAQLFPAKTNVDLVAHFAAVIERANAGLDAWPNTAQMDHAYLQLRMQRWQGRIASSTDQVRPCLSPFMFRAVLETLLQTEHRLRQRGLLVRKLLARLQPRLATYPLVNGYPAGPLTWRSLHRLTPLLGGYWNKAWDRGWRVLGLKREATSVEPARLQLWREEAVRELLRPERMLLSEWLDGERLRAFLRASQRPEFAYERQWSRVLSLECALRAARENV